MCFAGETDVVRIQGFEARCRRSGLLVARWANAPSYIPRLKSNWNPSRTIMIVPAALTVVTLLLAVATLLPLWKNPHWLVRGLDFPRLLLITAALVLLGALAAMLDRTSPLFFLLSAVTSACMTWQAAWILPYTRLWPVEVPFAPKAELSILASNVLMTNRNSGQLIELIDRHEPDIVVTLESDAWWEQQLAEIETERPYAVKCPLDNLYGMHVYSRWPLLGAETRFLIEDDVPSIHATVQHPNGQYIDMHFLHPAPPSPTENEKSTARDAELVTVARLVARRPGSPVVVTGDLNDVAWSSTTRLFRKISGLLDPRVGRGMFNTYHAKWRMIRWPLDHIFVSAHFGLVSMERLPPMGSDHFPVLTRLAIEKSAAGEQDGLTADQEDRRRAREIKSNFPDSTES